MERAHDLGDRTFSIKCEDKLLDRIRCKNLLGVHLNEHLMIVFTYRLFANFVLRNFSSIEEVEELGALP